MISVSNVSLQYGKRILFDEVNVKFTPGNCYGLIGANGAGKSTFMKILSGEIDPTKGQVNILPGMRLSVLKQNHFEFDEFTVLDTILMGNKRLFEIMKEKDAIYAKPDFSEADGLKAADLEAEFGEMNGWNAESDAATLLTNVGIPVESHFKLMKDLTGKDKVKILLSQAIFGNPDILLLDEPTNHLDAESVDWLEQHLQQYKGTIIAVTHDRYFLDNVAGWILELDRGEGIPWKGNYSSWLEQKGARLKQEEKTESKRQKVLARELDWIRQGVKGRGVKQKARLNNYDKMMGEDSKTKEENLEIFIPNGPRLGNEVIEAINVSKAFGDRLLYEGLNFKLPPAGIVGIIGPNGAGKTTLFRMVMGEEKPTTGEFLVGPTVKLSYVDQNHKELDPNKTVYDVISGGLDNIVLGGKPMNSRAYISRFNFAGSDQGKKVSVLSGGERNRLHLAMALKEEGNVLLLDEPTNDLDVNTLRALEEGLENFAGCAVIISHDRWFLDRVCTHILAFEGDSSVYWFEGGYSEYEENRKKRLGNVEPKRPRYKKLAVK
jgi:ATP-binding cassette ChvD family protein